MTGVAKPQAKRMAPMGYFEQEGGQMVFYPDSNNARLEHLFDGLYAGRNFLTLFYCVPEVAAPVHEIASRVADAVYELKKSWNDETDYKHEAWNRFITRPNPFMDFRTIVYMSVCYEILTGRQYFYRYIPSALKGMESFSEVVNLWSWPAHQVVTRKKRSYDIYTAATPADVIDYYEVVDPGTYRSNKYSPEDVLPSLNLDLRAGVDVCRTAPEISGASQPIKNLIPVYEARGNIFISRGATGFWVSEKSDDSGTVPLTPSEKEEAQEDFQATYGLTNGKRPIGVSALPMKFVRSVMDMSEMQPFDETAADALAIYTVLRVPRHLCPTKDPSTYDNAESDMKSFYENNIIPRAQRIAAGLTPFLYLDKERRYINPSFKHVGVLQGDKLKEAQTANLNGKTQYQAVMSGAATMNEWMVSRGEQPKSDPLFNKTTLEMTEEELTRFKAAVNMKSAPAENENEDGKPAPENTGTTA